ncbi:MAG: NADH-quinone oxidoreductase subunit L, partial [Armatimonadota bacterium]|nr:NADH-quinone oxidoreductase subunit L [bacterium]MDW8321981.1 NADH-quinone oxidoreductase subunit L [Armatimonadota bacterium]
HVQAKWLVVGDWSIFVGARLDGLSALMMVIVSTVSLAVQVYSVGYMAGDSGFARYFAVMALFTAAMLGLVLADNLLLLYMSWELVGLCSYLLIGFWYRKPEAANAAKKAFVVTRFGDVGFLVGLILLSYAAGTFQINQIETQVANGALNPLFGSLPTFATVVALLLFCGAVGKSAQFPLHIWLPDAMEGPTPVSALIHAATMVAAGVFLVARMFFLFEIAPVAMQVVTLIGGFTAFMAATIALTQFDIKRVLAYSTISQLGYMMMALGLGDRVAAMFHLGTHAYFKSLLFLTAGSVIHATHTQDMREMGGLLGKMRLTAGTALIGALALAGIFPLSGFWSKDEILLAAWTGAHPFAFAAGLATALLTAFYMARLWVMTFLGEPRSEHAQHAHESPPVMSVPLLLLAAAATVGGLGASAVRSALQNPASEHASFSLTLAAVATVIAVLGMLAGYRAYRMAKGKEPLQERLPAPVYTLLERKWFVDDFFTMAVARAVLLTASVVAWIDRRVVDGIVNAVAWFTGATGARLRWLTNGQAQFYVLVLVLSILATVAAVLSRFQ